MGKTFGCMNMTDLAGYFTNSGISAEKTQVPASEEERSFQVFQGITI
jgi:hypothetical protein